MSPEELKARNERFFAEVLNNPDFSRLEKYISPEYKLHDVQPPLEGQAGFRQLLEGTRVGFPDIHFTMEDCFAEGDKMVVRWTMQGTQKGEYNGFPPTGNVATGRGITIARLDAEGREVDAWIITDNLNVLLQLGAIQMPGQSPVPA
jgi:predicted ester cyclase